MSDPVPAPTPDDTKTDPAPVVTPPKPEPPKDEPLGEGGEKALKAERARANAADKAVKDLEAQLLVFTDRDKSEADKFAERLAAAEKTATDASGRLVRYEVAVEKQIPAHLMEFVTGTSREDVEASVTKVLAAFTSSKPTGPQPDPSQGAGGTPVGLDEQIRAATERGDTREAIRLKTRKSISN